MTTTRFFVAAWITVMWFLVAGYGVDQVTDLICELCPRLTVKSVAGVLFMAAQFVVWFGSTALIFAVCAYS